MSEAVIVVGLVRVLAALPVLRWPLAGAVLAILVDLADLALFSYLGLGWPADYQRFDKAADLAYLTTFLVVALRWGRPERQVAIALFGLRLVGIGAYELGGTRAALLAFPNVFELWFLAVAARDRFAPGAELAGRRAALTLAALLVAKLAQEYLLHVDRRLDRYSLVDVVDRLRGLLGP